MVYDREKGGSTFLPKVVLGLSLILAGVLPSAASLMDSTICFSITCISLVASFLLSSLYTTLTVLLTDSNASCFGASPSPSSSTFFE